MRIGIGDMAIIACLGVIGAYAYSFFALFT
jgi:hypothetical protein